MFFGSRIIIAVTALLFSGGATAGDYDHIDRDGHSDPETDPRDSGLIHATFADSLDAVTETQLAGNSLDEYPFFEYVKAFNEDTTVELAIDPTRFPEIFGIPPNETNEILYYPTNIADMDPLPLMVIGHGSGHSYLWYDFIGYHMASYGYIVMSHQNHPVSTVLGHTDAILELQDVIAGGALDGKIDSSRIVWIGHSFGAISAVTAYDRLVNGEYIPTHYTEDSIVLISSMLPPAGTGLDLSGIEAVSIDVGPSWGTKKGRIVVDELMLTND